MTQETYRADKRPEGGPVGNVKAQKHGGHAGVKSLTKGEPLHGLALEACENVTRRRVEVGNLALLQEHYDRRRGVADLFYAAILGCEDLPTLTSLSKVWGWLDEGAARILRDVIAAEKEASRGGVDAGQVLAAYKDGDNGEQSSE